jgi:DNA polymerase-3 subunit epsilon
MSLEGLSFTVFDLETTGLNPERGDRIVEIAGVRIERGVIQEQSPFFSLVNPEQAIPSEAIRVHGISEQDLRGAPTVMKVLPDFLRFAEESILVAHNAEFDLGFLEAEKEGCWGYIDLPECLCTLCLSRAVSPQEYQHGLDATAQRLGLSRRAAHHRALPDALLTAKVFLQLLKLGKIHSLEQLRKLASPKLAAAR